MGHNANVTGLAPAQENDKWGLKMNCPNGNEIIEYATSRGVKNARIENEYPFGWSLLGGGVDDDGRWPLVWAVAKECGISWGCGTTDKHQINPKRFKQPNAKVTGVPPTDTTKF